MNFLKSKFSDGHRRVYEAVFLSLGYKRCSFRYSFTPKCLFILDFEDRILSSFILLFIRSLLLKKTVVFLLRSHYLSINFDKFFDFFENKYIKFYKIYNPLFLDPIVFHFNQIVIHQSQKQGIVYHQNSKTDFSYVNIYSPTKLQYCSSDTDWINQINRFKYGLCSRLEKYSMMSSGFFWALVRTNTIPIIEYNGYEKSACELYKIDHIFNGRLITYDIIIDFNSFEKKFISYLSSYC